jgi:hypothetical protein
MEKYTQKQRFMIYLNYNKPKFQYFRKLDKIFHKIIRVKIGTNLKTFVSKILHFYAQICPLLSIFHSRISKLYAVLSLRPTIYITLSLLKPIYHDLSLTLLSFFLDTKIDKRKQIILS